MNLKVNWRQSSTWRGLIMLVAGVLVGGLTFFGYTEQANQYESVLNIILGLVSGGMSGSGLIGVITNDGG